MHTSHEYINDFLYFVIRHGENRRSDTLLYCSGVNIDRFLPITRGRHRPMSNPAIRGLQLVNLGVRDMALSQGAVPKPVRGNDCAGIAPTRDDWYKELLLIEGAPEALPGKIIGYCVVELLKKFDRIILLGAPMPDSLLQPLELQQFLESLCTRYG